MTMTGILGIVLALVPLAALAAAADEPSKPLEITGKLSTGIVAIGGETTGIVLRNDHGTWELDVGDDAELKQACERLNGRQVRVTGKLRTVPGVEVPQRRIVRVAKIEAAR